MVKRILIISIIVLGLFLNCSILNPTTKKDGAFIATKIIWQIEDSIVIPVHIKTLRTSIFSADLPSKIIQTFSFSEKKGNIKELPVGINVKVLVEGLDSLDNVIYSGSDTLDDISEGEINLTIVAKLIQSIPPHTLVGTLLDYTSIKLNWQKPSFYVSSYVIERTTDTSLGFDSLSVSLTTEYIDLNLDSEIKYFYRILAINPSGVSLPSFVVDITTFPNDTVPPLLNVKSHNKIDTLSYKITNIYGTVFDASEIKSIKINDSIISINGSYWEFNGVSLKDSMNFFEIIVEDIYENIFKDTLKIFFDAEYVVVVNHAPYFDMNYSLNATYRAGEIFEKVLLASDVDEFNTFTYYVSSPCSLVNDSVVKWLADTSDIGIHNLYAIVWDQDSALDTITWTINILDPKINLPPTFISTSSSMTNSALMDGEYIDTVFAVDVDQDNGLVYSVIAGSDSIHIDSISGIITWSPKLEDVGVSIITVQVRDDSMAVKNLSWSIEIKHPNYIVFNAGADTVVSINDIINLHPDIEIVSGDISDIQWGLGGEYYTTANGDTNVIAPSVADSNYECILRIIDNNSNIIEDKLNVIVLLDPPKANAGLDKIIPPGNTVHLLGFATDVFGTIEKWEWDLGNLGDFVESFDRRASFTMPDQNTNFECVLKVTDDDGNIGLDTVVMKILQSTMREINPAVEIDTFFTMGSLLGELDERPEHIVVLSKFLIDTTEVTQASYLQLMGVNPSSTEQYLPNYPVESVTWFDAVLYCNERSKLEGFDTVYSYTSIEGEVGDGCLGLGNLYIDYTIQGFRLPTEAEWEFAYRAGTKSNYYWGDNTSSALEFAIYGGGVKTSASEIMTSNPNDFELYDMAGNVWEWCNDWYFDYSSANQNNPIGPSSGNLKVIRGGAYKDEVTELRAANRGYGLPDWITDYVGFRVVLPIFESN